MHWTHLVFCFTWDSVSIPRIWTSASWKGQFRCKDSEVRIVISAHVSTNSSVTMLFVHTLSFGLCSFIEVCQNMFPISYLKFWFILHVYHPEQNFFLIWWDMSSTVTGKTGPCLTWGPVRATPRCFLLALDSLVCFLLIYIHCPTLVLASSSTESRRLRSEPLYFYHCQRRHYF